MSASGLDHPLWMIIDVVHNRPMTEAELIALLSALPGVVTQTAREGDGSPELAWGDSFFSYDPDGDLPAAERFPFATIVTKDYPGFDAESNLDRPGVFRLNLNVGRARFEELLGFPPAGFTQRHNDFDYAESDRVLPHPAYAVQGWISIVMPGERTADQLPALIESAHDRAQRRYQQSSGSTREDRGIRER